MPFVGVTSVFSAVMTLMCILWLPHMDYCPPTYVKCYHLHYSAIYTQNHALPT
jgi:hypothetical protein